MGRQFRHALVTAQAGQHGSVIRRRVLVSGVVQGVWFRDSCRHEAEARGVSGWIRNTSDGSVEAVFEGEADQVEQLVDWCHVGPPRARVAAVVVHDEEPRAEVGFVVR
jgi:acylphosphatase